MTTDILISFDTTGSMSSAISEVRRRVKEMVVKILTTISDSRIAIVAHGDYCDPLPIAMQTCHFTNDIDKLVLFVQNAKNTGGGDSDEFYEKVIHDAKYLDWQADNRIMMLIGDANPHRKDYFFRGVTSGSFDWKEEADGLNAMGVNIYSVQALARREADAFYQEVADRTNGRRVSLNQFSDAVETILAICYHKNGTLDDFRLELENGFKMNRNLANLLNQLDNNLVVSDVRFVAKDSSGLIPVSPARFQIVHVEHDCSIKDFVLSMGIPFKIGRGFYELSKKEEVQENKEIILRNKLTGDMFTGSEARDFIGIPFGSRGDVSPRYSEKYDVFIQSTSPNRKLIGGCKFLYENI